jgi:hypothetical protein
LKFWGPLESTTPNDSFFIHYVDDGNWWLARYIESTNILQWNRIGNTQGQSGSPYNFGNLGDGNHYVKELDFDGDGLQEVILYYEGDGNWFLGKFVDATQSLEWRKIGNTRDGRPYDFGELLDGHHYMLTGSFQRNDRESVIFINEGDGNCWVGTQSLANQSLDWHRIGNSRFGNLYDWQHIIWSTKFSSSPFSDILHYYQGDGNWWLGNPLFSPFWRLIGNTKHLGDWADVQHDILVSPNPSGFGDIIVHQYVDPGWRIGRYDGNSLTWTVLFAS